MTSRQTKSLKNFRGALVLIGAGKMGGAMIEGWLSRGLNPRQLIVIEPQPSSKIRALARRGLRLNPRGKTVASAVVFAVKPQIAAQALEPLAEHVGKSTLVLSIMAGRTLGFLQNLLPKGAAVVRAMPNTPAAIARGISVAVPNTRVSASQRKLASDLLSAIGAVAWIKDESLMDAVTALSGSGPAYVFLLAEAMEKAGIAAGLPAPLARLLAHETVSGSGELLHQSKMDAETLRKNVTSPGGTTAAALDALMAPGGLEDLMTRAIAAAANRSRELRG
ncbi:MAG TPA: pyrroline-5-carboxylate reductase [Pseudolabrys sp.]|nr:pyrroline-5-carboxylate reductase [Pseudolabrys sp.]